MPIKLKTFWNLYFLPGIPQHEAKKTEQLPRSLSIRHTHLYNSNKRHSLRWGFDLVCLQSIQSNVAARGPRGEWRRWEGVWTGDWTHSCGKEDLAWRGSADPHSPISLWLPHEPVYAPVCVCVAMSRRGVSEPMKFRMWNMWVKLAMHNHVWMCGWAKCHISTPS